jgi:cellulose biosynthesis protein BcsQ
VQRTPAGVVLVNAAGGTSASTTALNLAIAAARDDHSVLLVDAANGSGAITAALSFQGRAGLAEALLDGDDGGAAVQSVDVGAAHPLDVLPSGDGSSMEPNVTVHAIDRLVALWRESYDFVVVDAPPVGSGPLPSVLAGSVDGLLLVVGKGADERGLERLRRQMALQNVPILGYVFAAHRSR